MRVLWNELSPKDRYVVRLIRPVSFAEMGYITHLYLPLIGVEAFSLYQLLLHEVDERSGAKAEGTHRGLMLVTSLPLDRLLAARERLEAMGLLDVYRRESRDRDYLYEYVVKPPLTPFQFFQEEIWTVMLLNRVEKPRFEQLRRMYAERSWPDLDERYPYEENVTKRFYEVFTSLSASELEVRSGSETELFLARMEAAHPAVVMQGDYEAQANPLLDLSFIRLNLPSYVSAADVFTSENVTFLYRIIHFYQLSSWLLGQELRDWGLFTGDGLLDRDAVRKRFRERYIDGKLHRDAAVPSAQELGNGVLPEPGSAHFARVCRSYSPLLLLEAVVGGRISKAFLERAEALVFTDELPVEVVNALLLYVLRETNMELPKAYIETVRDSWKAKQISTVDEAVQLILAREEARQQAAAERTKAKKPAVGSRRKSARPLLEDKLPASVQRQLEQEQQTAEHAATEKKRKRTVMDDPELRALLESFPKPQKGER